MKPFIREKDQIRIWLETPIKERRSKAELCNRLGIRRDIFKRLSAELTLEKRRARSELKAIAKGSQGDVAILGNALEVASPDEQREVNEVLNALKKLCLKGNASAGKFWLQAKGEFVEKSEARVKLELSSEQLAREHIETRRWLNEHSYLEKLTDAQLK